MKLSALTLAMIAVFCQPAVALAAGGTDHVISSPIDDSGNKFVGDTVQVVNGGIWTGSGVEISSDAETLVSVESGATLSINDLKLNSNVDRYTRLTESQTLLARGEGADVNLQDPEITLSVSGHYPSHALSSTTAVVAENGASVTLNGGKVIVSGTENIHGLTAGNGGVINADSTEILAQSDNGHAVKVYSNDGRNIPTVVNLDKVSIRTEGYGSKGIHAEDINSTVTAIDTDITTLNAFGIGLEVSNGAQATYIGGSIETNDYGGDGVRATGTSGRESTALIDGTNILIKGDAAAGVVAGDAGMTHGNIVLRNSTVTTAAMMSSAAIANGGNLEIYNTGLETSGYASNGVMVQDKANSVLENVSIKTTGQGSYGIMAVNATVDANNIYIETSGSASDAVVASSGKINLDGGTIIASGENDSLSGLPVASAIYATGGIHEPSMGMDNAAGIIDAKNMSIVVRGAGGTGIKAGMGMAGLDIRLNGIVHLEDSRVLVTGDNARAADIGYGSTFTDAGSTLVSEKGDGIVLTDDVNVSLQGTTVQAARASLVSNLTRADQIQHIDIGAGSDLTKNNGTLLLINRTEDAMDGTVNLTLGADTVARGDIIDVDGLDASGERVKGGKTSFVVSDGATWMGAHQGLVEMVAGQNATIINEGGGLISRDVIGGVNSKINFIGSADIGGNFKANTGSSAQFQNGASIKGEVSLSGAKVDFTGPTVIGSDLSLDNASSLSGGSASAPIEVAGNALVSNESTLQGFLNVAGSLIANGGILSPGKSIGTQTFGSISHLGARYLADINAAGQSDLIIAKNGNIDLRGTALSVGQENGNGGYRLNHDYTIVQANNGNIEGNFLSADLDSSFDGALVSLDPVKVGAADVKISLSVAKDKVEDAKDELTDNQDNALDGVVSVPGQNGAADGALTTPNTADSLDQLSGEIHASAKSAIFYSGGQVRDSIADRFKLSLQEQIDTPLWGKIQGRQFSLDGDDNSARAKTESTSLHVGGDSAVGGGWRLGAVFGFTDSTTKVKDRSSAKAEVNSYTASIYAGRSWERIHGQVDFMAGSSYTHHDIKTRRQVTVGGKQTLEANYKASSIQVFSQLGYAFNVGSNTQVGPYLGLAWLKLDSGSFNENGGDAALHSNSSTDHILATTLGVNAKTDFEYKGAQTRLQAGLGWRHSSGDVGVSRTMSFITGKSSSFNIAGAPLAKNAAVFNVAISTVIGKNTTLGLGYNGQFGSGQTDNAGSVSLKMAF